MGNRRRICFSQYLTGTLFQNLKLITDFYTTGSAGLKRRNNGRKVFICQTIHITWRQLKNIEYWEVLTRLEECLLLY